MPARVFFPRISSDHNEFVRVIGDLCGVHNIRICMNKEGIHFCIVVINFADSKGRCANDIIDTLTGKVIGDLVVRPRMYVDQTSMKQLRIPQLLPKELGDDVAKVTHYHNDYYYLQLRSEAETYELLRESLHTIYGEYRSNMLSTLEYDELLVGGIYASLYKEEARLCRIKVLEKSDGDEARLKVLFIDYGNAEFIHDKPILEISKEIARIHRLCYRCTIDRIRIVDEKKHDSLAKEVINRIYNVKLVRTKNDDGKEILMAVDFLDFTSVSYRNFLIIENVAVDVDSAIRPARVHSDSGSKKEKTCDSAVGPTVVKAVMTHMASLEDFHVQLVCESVEAELARISKSILSLTEKPSQNIEFVSGSSVVYLSLYSADNNWYRCKVIEDKWGSCEPHCVVRYIDFGNSERKCSKMDLWPLTKNWGPQAVELAKIAPCAHQCSFSERLLASLAQSGQGVAYFCKELIEREKEMKLSYYCQTDEQIWIVDHFAIEGAQDLPTVPEAGPAVVRNLYRLSNMESLHKVWFKLVSTTDRGRHKELQSLRHWADGGSPHETRSVTLVDRNQIYCVLNQQKQRLRCRVTGKNADEVAIQIVDSGVHDVVPNTALSAVPPSIASIPATAHPYRLPLAVQVGHEQEVENQILDMLEQCDVKLDLRGGAVKDVITKQKSLIVSLEALGCVSRESVEEEACCARPGRDLGLCRMKEMPRLVALENSKMRSLRKLFNIDGASIFEDLRGIVTHCVELVQIKDCCEEGDVIAADLGSLNRDFSELLLDRRARLCDLQPILERRSSMSRQICSVSASLNLLMRGTSTRELGELQQRMRACLRAATNLVEVLGLSLDGSVSQDLAAMEDQVVQFQNTELYRDSLASFMDNANKTNSAMKELELQFRAICRQYPLSQECPDVSRTAVPLCDCVEELHTALQAENGHFLDLLAREEVREHFNIGLKLASVCLYLRTQLTAIDSIESKRDRLQALHERVKAMMEEDAPLLQRIEDSHRRVLTSRSLLRHAVPDLEDAEELEQRERQQELHSRIHDIRMSLHRELRMSAELIDPNVRKLMINKPELQFKNQSIILHEEGLPIFLWDSIYFDMSKESSDSYFSSYFESQKVKIKRIALSIDDYRPVLDNFSMYSLKTSGWYSGAGLVSVTPILYAFLSKCGNSALHLVTPDFVTLSSLAAHDVTSLPEVLAFFREVIDHIVKLCRLGFAYTEDDLRHGLLVAVRDGSATRVCLPMPLASITSRDRLSSHKEDSICVFMRQLGPLLCQTLEERCAGGAPLDCDETLGGLASRVSLCGSLSDAETVSTLLDDHVNHLHTAAVTAGGSAGLLSECITDESSPDVLGSPRAVNGSERTSDESTEDRDDAGVVVNGMTSLAVPSAWLVESVVERDQTNGDDQGNSILKTSVGESAALTKVEGSRNGHRCSIGRMKVYDSDVSDEDAVTELISEVYSE